MVDKDQALLNYVLRLGDNALVHGQRLIELVAHGPELEEELANANFSLDYLGQARMFYTYAGELEGTGRTEDDFAMLRPEHEYENLLLVEQPNGHFGETVVRSVLFESFYLLQLEALVQCNDAGLAEIAARAIKEIRYHLRFSSQWLIRLGDGTDESQHRVQTSLNESWKFTGEFFAADDVDKVVQDEFQGPNLEELQQAWRNNVAAIVAEATLELPQDQWMEISGREGRHSEHFGYLIAEMQSMQRAMPGLNW
jgi:ring-1,2-phenylacetyl-CoA epoxidase subunit PaaC